MPKEKLNKKQLEEKKEQLEKEIKILQNVIDASNSSVFDLLVNEVKKEMEINVSQEDWKALKHNRKKIENYRNIETVIQNQSELLEKKTEELDDIEYQIENYQPGLFDEQEAQDTGFWMEEFSPGEENRIQLQTGDIFQITNENTGSVTVYKIVSSKENGKYAIVGNDIDGELLLNYKKNRELLHKADYVGNVFGGEISAQKAAQELEKLI